MKQASLSWISVAAICGAILIFGVLFWRSGPKSEVSPPAARVDSPLPTSVSKGTATKLPFAESGDSARTTKSSVKNGIDARMASLARLTGSAPLAAARSLNAIPPGEERTIAIRTVFREWAAISPQNALAWISTMASEQERNEAREFVCYRVAEDDPKVAFDLARQAGADTATPLVQDLAQQWAAKDATAARNWALALPSGANRDQILAGICLVLSQSDPSTAGAIVSQEIAAGPVQDEATMSVLHQWAIRDPGAASEWVAQFPMGPLRTRAEKELAGIREYQAGAVGTQ